MRKSVKYPIVLILISFRFFSFSQQCGCEQKFQFIKHEIETNYAGYSDKVNPKTKTTYDKVTRETLAKVKKTKNDAYCLVALQEWLQFFKDGHVQLYDPHEPDMSDTIAINERIKKTEIIKITSEKLEQLEHSNDYEEGIYYYGDSSYKIAVIRSRNEFRDYAGVIISSKYPVWKEGQVKLELKKNNDSMYKAILYMRDHSYRPQLYYFNGTSFDGGNWNKMGKPQKVYAKAAPAKFHFEKVHAQKLSDSTLYIQIGTFDLSNAKAIDSVFKANEDLLKTIPYLIIDVRRNGGGGDEAYEPIIPWLYTNPIIGIGVDIYATNDNIQRLNQYLNNPDLSEGSKADIREMISRMGKNKGKFVLHNTDDTESNYTLAPYPKKVVILTDSHCASTTEQFLLAARQSAKVTLMGEHTYGELDYSNVLLAASPCKDIAFGYSSTRSRRIEKGQGIDNVGIKPDIVLSYDKDWIQAAREYIEK